jgi:phage-related protein
MFLNKNESIADSNNFKGINYYEIFHFTGVLSNSGISGYEKYLFEKYFDLDGLYFAKENVPAGDSYSPITFTGKNYWTQKIDDLFTLSYGSSANFSAKLSRLDFGDGYKTNVVSTLNSLESKFSLAYDGLTDKQSKALIAFFENTPEAKNKSLYEGFEGVRMNIFTPYKNDAELYFLNINHDSSYKDLNKITIEATSLYESILDYKGMFVVLNENAIKTYTNELSTFEYNDVFYYNSDDLNYKGYYFYTGENISLQTTGPSGPFAPEFSPTGENSYFTKEFYFKPDIDYNINENIRLRTTEYKNSTKQFSKDGINPNMLEFDLKFSKRSTKEARAILKFLDDKAGYKIFNYTLPQPYNKQIEVYSPEWSHSYDYFDNHTINVKFIQTKSLNKAVCTFNTNINFFSPSYFDADYIKYYNNVNVLNPNIVPNTEDSSYTNRSNYKWVMLVFPDIEKGTTTKLTSLTITDYDNAENDFCKKYAVYLPAGSTVPTTSVAIYDTKSEYWIYTNPNPSKYHEAIKIYAGTGFQHPDEITLFSSYATDIYTNKLDTSEGGEKIETTELRESSNSSSSTTLFQIYTAINNSGNLGGDGSFENPYIIDIL